MSEHTPLTEAEREALLRWVWQAPTEGTELHAALCDEVERILAARTSTATADTEALRRVVVRETNLGLDDFRMGRASNDALASRMLDAIRPFLAAADAGLRQRMESLIAPRTVHDAVNSQTREIRKVHVRVSDVLAALDATPASTEDRADNEGTR